MSAVFSIIVIYALYIQLLCHMLSHTKSEVQSLNGPSAAASSFLRCFESAFTLSAVGYIAIELGERRDLNLR